MSLPGTGRASGLYVAAWALCGSGLAVLLLAWLTQSLPPIVVIAALIALVAGLLATAGYQLVSRRTRSPDRYRGPSPLILFALQIAFVNGLGLLLLALGIPVQGSSAGFFVTSILLLSGYLFVVWLFVVRSGVLGWREIVRSERPSASEAAFDVAIGGATMFGVALVAGIVGGLLAKFLGTEAPDILPTPNTAPEILLLALGAGVLVPIGEEVFFRGFSITAWLRDLGPRSALLRATIFFALIHVLNVSSTTFEAGAKQALLELAVIGPIGLALGWLYLRRGLIASIAGHAAFNLFGVLILVLAQYLPPQGIGA